MRNEEYYEIIKIRNLWVDQFIIVHGDGGILAVSLSGL